MWAHTTGAQSSYTTLTYRQDHPVLEIGGVLVTLLAKVFRSSASLRDLLVTVRTGTGLVETALLLSKGHIGLGVEVVWLLTVA